MGDDHRHTCGNPRESSRHDNRACGCGSGHVSIHCKKLMEQLRAVDFALYETVLYLDAYPHSCDALETYRKLQAQRDALRKEYEEVYGPLTAFGNSSSTSWDWMNPPFPWEYDAE
jgi:spore coat protein JB